jgi:hypothetical protein
VAEQSKFNRLYLNSGKVSLAAIYLRRIFVACRSYAAGAPPLTHVSTVFTPPSAPAAQNLGVGLQRPCRGQQFSRGVLTRKIYSRAEKNYQPYLYSGKVALAPMYLRRVRVVRRSFAVGAPPLTHVSTVFTPPAPAAKILGSDLRRPCRETDVWRNAWGNGAHRPCAARHATSLV